MVGGEYVRLIIATMVRTLFSGPVSQKPASQLVFRLIDPCEVKDVWVRRIIGLADGRTIEEISEEMYLEESGSGAWVSDVGLWRNLFHRDVANTIGGLASRGYVRLEDSSTPAFIPPPALWR